MKNPFKRVLDEQIEALETLPPQSVFGQISRFVGLASILLLVIFNAYRRNLTEQTRWLPVQ